MARALVLGANGFIGAPLVRELGRRGHEVTAFDRYSSGDPSFASDVRIARGDFLSSRDLIEAVEGQQLVFHFLSTTTPATAENDPTLDVRTNIAQTIELLEACVRAGVEHVYFASTGGAIYGPQGRASYAETDRALPVSPYGIGKLTIEHYLRYFREKHGLASTALRISNPYGPGQSGAHRQGLIGIALRRIARGLPVIRYGDGSMVRDYIFVDDVVSMIGEMTGRTTRFDLYNVGSGVGHTVNDILDVMADIVGHPLEILNEPKPATFVDQVVLDVGRFADEFGGRSTTGLEDGIQRTWTAMNGSADG